MVAEWSRIRPTRSGPRPASAGSPVLETAVTPAAPFAPLPVAGLAVGQPALPAPAAPVLRRSFMRGDKSTVRIEAERMFVEKPKLS